MSYFEQLSDARTVGHSSECAAILADVAAKVAKHKPAEGSEAYVRQTLNIAFDQWLSTNTQQLGRDTLVRLCAIADEFTPPAPMPSKTDPKLSTRPDAVPLSTR